MRSHRLIILFVTILSVLVISTMASLHSQKHRRLSKEQEVNERPIEVPITDFDAPEPSDLDEQRRVKRKRHDVRNRIKLTPSEVESATKHNDWEFGLASTLPTAQSSAIVIGNVSDAKAYLSEDKTGVYSEFTVRVEEVLKNDSNQPIAVGDLIVTERSGGGVRLHSGHIARYYIAGQGIPQTGGRYVFFLGFNSYEAKVRSVTDPAEMSRHILTAYELRTGEVFPLDAVGGLNFKEHRGKDETTFLNAIRRAVVDSSRVSP